jgi:hypothetical protein
MSGTVYHLVGTFLGFNIRDTRNSLQGARERLEELAATGNDVAESDPYYRNWRQDRFVLTDAPLPELMDRYAGSVLITIEEQKV